MRGANRLPLSDSPPTIVIETATRSFSTRTSLHVWDCDTAVFPSQWSVWRRALEPCRHAWRLFRAHESALRGISPEMATRRPIPAGSRVQVQLPLVHLL